MSTRKYSTQQEKFLAKKLKGKVSPNSGGTRFGGGDVLLDDWLIEAKTPTVDKMSFTVKKEWLKKAEEQAFEQGKNYSTLAFRFEPLGQDYFIINFRTFKELLDYMEQNKNIGEEK